MPDFVESVANQQMPPPYHFPDVTAHAFMFEAPMSAVQRYCDTHLNLGSDADRGFRYSAMPMFPYAALMAVQYPVMMSYCGDKLGYNEAPFAQRGYTSQNEIFVAMPVLRHGLEPGTALLEAAVEWALPFVAVDNSTSAFSGREMLGLPKLIGPLSFGESSFPGSFAASARLPGWKSASDVQQILDFLTITTGPPIGSGPGTVPSTSFFRLFSGHYVRRGLEVASAALSGLDSLANGLLPSLMHTVALKQFRDAAQPDLAVYQALISARTRYTDISNLKFYDEHDIEIVFSGYPSFWNVLRVFMDLPEETPEDAATGHPVVLKPCAAYSFNADIDFDQVRTLHTFIADGVPVKRGQQAREDTAFASWVLPLRGFFSRG